MKKAPVFYLRSKIGLSQSRFWKHLGVSQSAGSKYESGERVVPEPLGLLIQIVYFESGLGFARRLRREIAQ